MGIKTYKDVASMQNNPSATGSTGATRGKPKTATGGRIKVATGGRVKRRGGGKWDKSRGHPGEVHGTTPITPPPLLPGERRGRNPKRRDPAALLAAKRRRAAQRSLRKSPPPSQVTVRGAGMKKGGRATKARGGKAKR